LAWREIVGKAGPPKSADIGKEKINGLSDKGINEEAIVLFGLGKTHLMHSIPTPEAVSFNPGRNVGK